MRQSLSRDHMQEIKEMWEEIESQNTDNIEFNIICQNEECCIVNFIIKDYVSYDMIYQIKLTAIRKKRSLILTA